MKLTGSMTAAALVLTAAGPAAARGWGPPPLPYRYHRHDSDAGVIIGTIAAVGLIAAIASAASAKKKRQAAERGYEDAPPYPQPGQDERDYDGHDGNAARYETPRSSPWNHDGSRTDPASQDAAVDACAIAARDEGTRIGGFAEVREITGISPLGTGWDVAGRIEKRTSYRATDGQVLGFRCAYQDGRVSAVSLE